MKLDKRQKFILGFVVIAVVILIWQLYSLFGGGTLVPSSMSKTTTITSLKAAGGPTEVMQPSLPAQSIKSALTPEVTENQQQYLALVNEYQLVEIQRLIAQDQAAIASARASMAESLAKMNQASSGNTGNIDSPGALASSIVAANNQPGDYELIYTGQDNGEWSATLKRNGQFNDVTAGSILPDGDKVLSVDDNGVLIQQGDLKKLVTFNGVTPVNNKPADEASVPAAAALQTQLQPPASLPVKTKQVETTKSSTESTQSVKTASLPARLPVPVLEKSPVLPTVVATNAPAVIEKSAANFDISRANKKYYTIQIISVGNFGAVKAYVDQNRLKNSAQVLKVWRHEKPWYIAVIGEYANSSAANIAIKKLPEAVQDEGPFVRRIEDVQSEMVK